MGVRTPFEGPAVLLRGCDTSALREWVAQCHKADTGLTAECRAVTGTASLGGLAKQRRGMILRRVKGVAQIRL
jgi:hypothetical protein